MERRGGKGRGNRSRSRASGGFTLLELLIAMTLLASIVLIAMAGLRAAARSVAAGDARMEEQERLRTVLSLIDAQIQSHFPLVCQEQGRKSLYFTGARKALRFSTNHSLWGGQQGHVVVTYRIDADGAGREVLHLSEQRPGMGDPREVRLIEAEAMAFDYFCQAPTEETGRWMDAPPEGIVIPERIRFHLSHRAGDFSLVCPVRVRPSMTPAQGGGSGP